MRSILFTLTCVLATAGACSSEDEPAGGVPPSAQTATLTTTQAVGAAVAISAPFAREPAPAGDGDTMEVGLVESSVAQSGALADAGCVAFSWSGMTASVRFTGCVIAHTGKTLDGTATLTVSRSPSTVSLSFEQLVYGDDSLDGALMLSWSAGVLVLDADLTYASAGVTRHVVLTELAVRRLVASVVVSGAAHVDDGTTGLDVSLTAVTWAAGDCSPSSGSLRYQDGSQTVTVTFLPTTPDDGVVMVQIGAQPAVPMALLPACA